MSLKINNDVFIVIQHKHVKPGKGGAFARIKLKNAETNQIMEKNIKPAEADKIDEVYLEERKLQNLYARGDTLYFMDNTTYEEVAVDKNILGDALRFLQENMEVAGLFFNDKLLKINLPIFINAEITYTEPGFRGDTSKSGTNKPATIDTGATINIPLFVNTGDRVKVDTRTGDYVERVKK